MMAGIEQFIHCRFINMLHQARISGHQIAQWRDRFPMSPEEKRSAVATYPYLGSTFEFVEKLPGYVSRIQAVAMDPNREWLRKFLGEGVADGAAAPRSADRRFAQHGDGARHECADRSHRSRARRFHGVP